MDRALRHSPELAGLVWIASDELPVDSSRDWNGSRRLDPDALAYLQYTSGSTRSPKGVMVTHQNLLATIDDLHRGGPLAEGGALVSWLPHFHDMGLVYGLLVPVALGVRGYLMPPASFIQRPARWLEAISRFGATHSAAPNFAYELCVRRVLPEQKAELDLRLWAVALNGAEPVRRETLEKFADAFRSCGFAPSAFSPGYGLAEATLKVTMSNRGVPPTRFYARASELERGRVREAEEPGEGRCFIGCGRPGLGTEVLIVDPETLVPRGPDEVGEIWVDSPSVAQGYWNRPEESARVFEAVPAGETGRRRFLRTGDLGFLREGELFVTGRLKDLVIIRGRNHYPQDIELTVQNSHPALRADGGAAFAVEVDGAERLVVVHEVDRHYRQNTNDVAEMARAAIVEEHEIAPYAVVLVRQNGVPKTSSGKVQRSACARAFLEGTLPVLSEWREGSMASEETAALASPSREDMETFLARQLSRGLQIPLDEIDVSQPFSSFGLDSAGTMTLLGEIESFFGRRLSPTLFWNYPTISELAAHLAEAHLEGTAAANGGD
jgi:acyl-CoA synthetase (AMP-forming)/AMP-acid ligase II/acyl carrier protein